MAHQDLPVTKYTDPTLLKTLQGHKEKITKAIFNPNLKQVITSSNDGLIFAWGLRPNARPNRFKGHDGPVLDVAIDEKQNIIASAGRDSYVYIWENNASTKFVKMKGHSAPVKSVAFNTDGSMLVSSGDDKLVKIWNVEKKQFISSFGVVNPNKAPTGHQNWVRSAQFSLDSRMIASGSDDRTVKIWDVLTSNVIHTFVDHQGMVASVNFHPDGSCLASCGSDKKIKIFDVRSTRLLQHYDAHNDAVNSVFFHSNGQYLVSSSNDSTVKIWDLRKGQILYTIFGHEGPSTTATFSPLGDYLLTGGQDQNVVIWNTNINPVSTEELYGVAPTRLNTDHFITDKADIKKMPQKQTLDKKEKKQIDHGKSLSSTWNTSQPKKEVVEEVEQANTIGNREKKGPNYKELQPEVKQCIDKLIYQLELCRNTLGLLEHRISKNEYRLLEVVEFIKHETLNYVSCELTLCSNL